jgi:RHS repeat-associated protein
VYGWDVPESRIRTWSQKSSLLSPSIYTFGYDPADQLITAMVTNAGSLVASYAYTYDPAGNRLTEQAGGFTNAASYNALNELSVLASAGGSGASRTNEWDAEQRLVSATSGNQRTEFGYDGVGKLVSIRQIVNGSEVSLRRLQWCDDEICAERDGAGAVTKRYFNHGVQVVSGPAAGKYYNTVDHLGSIREMIDTNGTVRARYSYDPWGRRTRVSGDLDVDFGFAGMFWCAEAGLEVARFRYYNPEDGRWLSRDPLEDAEMEEGANLYAYVANDPVNRVDPLGLCDCAAERQDYADKVRDAGKACNDNGMVAAQQNKGDVASQIEADGLGCENIAAYRSASFKAFKQCLQSCRQKTVPYTPAPQQPLKQPDKQPKKKQQDPRPEKPPPCKPKPKPKPTPKPKPKQKPLLIETDL